MLDDTTCRLITERYHFRPSLDPAGRPVRSQIVEDHSWVTIDDPDARDAPSPDVLGREHERAGDVGDRIVGVAVMGEAADEADAPGRRRSRCRGR